jgi:hypothetical protein
MKSALVGSAIFFGFAVAATAAIPHERPLTSPAYGQAPGSRGVAATASNENEVRNDFGRGAMYAAQVAAIGTVLDDTGVRIDSGTPPIGIAPWSSGPEMRM